MGHMHTFLDPRRLSSLAADPDFGPYTWHPMDPRHEPDQAVDELVAQIEEAEQCLRMARQALAVSADNRSLQCVRSLMNEARGWLEFEP